MDAITFLRPWQGLALFNLLSRSPSEVTRSRAETLKRLCALKQELHEKEKILRRTMPAHVEQVVKRKAVLLFSELLKECG
eukprot:4029109-Amphidinium_carterae.1